jgi:hypothetical protein
MTNDRLAELVSQLQTPREAFASIVEGEVQELHDRCISRAVAGWETAEAEVVTLTERVRRPEETGELLYLARMGLASLKAPADTQLKPTPDMVGNAEHTLRVATDATADNYAPLKEAVISWAVYWQDTGDNTMLGEAVKRLRTAQSSDDRNKDG